MDQKLIRNIAIIAHVAHGKTTIVDQFLRWAKRDGDEITTFIQARSGTLVPVI